MNILWISIESPLPMNTGGRVGVYKRLSGLAKEHGIFYFYLYDNPEETEYIEKLRALCCEVHAYPRKNSAAALVKSLFLPYTVASRDIRALKKDIETCIRNNQIDLINVDFPHMLAAIKNLSCWGNIPVVLNEHNIEWMVYRNIAQSAGSRLRRLAYSIDTNRLKRYEEKAVGSMPISRFTFVSESDMRYYAEWMNIDNSRLSLVPVGADDTFQRDADCEREPNVVFVGNMAYMPNIEAAEWFTGKVMPFLRKRVKGVKFFIVGRSPAERVKRLGCDDIIVTGTVEDIGEYYRSARLVVLPLLHGGGVKIKLLEAVGYKKLIVATTKGIEGTRYACNGLIPFSDDPVEFAELCCMRLQSPENFQEERKSVHDFFLQNYTWKSICMDYSMLLKSVAENA
ncbi:MAG TPA: glycosyltransferase [Caproiciproducens sp.]|nr:glycosyltransferase [Caproiciproducens sp.]